MEKKRKIDLKLLAAILGLLAAILLVFIDCTFEMGTSEEEKKECSGGLISTEEDPLNLSILCVGDVMAHSTNITSAKQSNGTYDFSDNYEYVKSYIEAADVALCNVETTFGGDAPRGYPTFCAPDSLADALKDAGFDIAFTSNNHMMDSGFSGMQRTLEILRNRGLTTAGSRYDGEKGYAIYDAPVTDASGQRQTVKLGVVAYTYETTGEGDATPSINSISISADSEKLINSFNYNELETTDYAKIKADVDGAKADGADIVICYMHWGNEYQREPDENETAMAQRLADMGADIIFASHPHVLQKVDVLTASDGDQVPVFYSMGNFISNQRTETLPSIANKEYTEQGMMAMVDIVYDKNAGKITAETVKVVPTWVDRYDGAGKKLYRIIPLDANLSQNQTLINDGHMERASRALELVRELIGDEYLNGKAISMVTEAIG